jgi:hypothetical protein
LDNFLILCKLNTIGLFKKERQGQNAPQKGILPQQGGRQGAQGGKQELRRLPVFQLNIRGPRILPGLVKGKLASRRRKPETALPGYPQNSATI